MRLIHLRRGLADTHQLRRGTIRQRTEVQSLTTRNNVSRFRCLAVRSGLAATRTGITSLRQRVRTRTRIVHRSRRGCRTTLDVTRHLKTRQRARILTSLGRQQRRLSSLRKRVRSTHRRLTRSALGTPVSNAVCGLRTAINPIRKKRRLLSLLPTNRRVVLRILVRGHSVNFITPNVTIGMGITTLPFRRFNAVSNRLVDVDTSTMTRRSVKLIFPTGMGLDRSDVRGTKRPSVRLLPKVITAKRVILHRQSILSFVLRPVTGRLDRTFSIH